MSGEFSIQQESRVEASRFGVHLWRNNSGVLYDDRGVPVRFGLGNDSSRLNEVFKSSDLIGIRPWDGKFCAFEMKPPGWRGVRSNHERAQEAFINEVRRCHGVAGFVTSLDELRTLILTP